jgi:hypothetical protein
MAGLDLFLGFKRPEVDLAAANYDALADFVEEQAV